MERSRTILPLPIPLPDVDLAEGLAERVQSYSESQSSTP